MRVILAEQGRWVVSFFVDVLFPIRNNHQAQAEKVRKIFDAFRAYHPEIPNFYSIVGHSVGATIALLVAGERDIDRVDTVIALDPVDQLPTRFTNETGPN